MSVARSCATAGRVLIDHTDELAALIVREHGKPLADAKGEIAYSAEFFRWNAEETVRIRGELGLAPSGTNRMIVHHPPVGVVAMITPWNFPAAMITRKLAPALGAGNGVVIKPPRRDAADASADRRPAAGGGRAQGARQRRAHQHLPANGSTPSSTIRRCGCSPSPAPPRSAGCCCGRAADRVLKTVMELGGNAPFIVFDDADIDAAVEGAMIAKMRHSAETCTAANRFYVEAGCSRRVQREVHGRDGRRQDRQRLRRRRHVRSADQQEGGRRRRRPRAGRGRQRRHRSLLGGKPQPGAGCFYIPTVLR